MSEMLGDRCARCGSELLPDDGIVTDERRQHKFVDHCLSAVMYGRAKACAEVERLRQTLTNCVLAMRLWGAEEDGIPDGGPIGLAYDRACKALKGER